jgi:hypothetical protein
MTYYNSHYEAHGDFLGWNEQVVETHKLFDLCSRRACFRVSQLLEVLEDVSTYFLTNFGAIVKPMDVK